MSLISSAILVWSTNPTMKQCIWVMLTLQVARRQCFNSPSTRAAICIYSSLLASARSTSVPHSLSLSAFHYLLSNLLIRSPLCRTAIDHRLRGWRRDLKALMCAWGFKQHSHRVGVSKLFGSMVTGTLMVLTVKYHLTSCVELVYFNYSWRDILIHFQWSCNGAITLNTIAYITSSHSS